MSETVTTTVKLPGAIHQKLLLKLVEEGYGLRGKSKWIKDAIIQFLTLNNYPELVDIADEMENHNEILSARLPLELMKNLDAAVIEVRKYFPGMEGVKSKIIRASILQALIRKS